MSAQVTIDTTVLSEKIEELVEEHGGLKNAAEHAGVSFQYLSKLRNGERFHPSASVLHGLGLTKVVMFKRNPE